MSNEGTRLHDDLTNNLKRNESWPTLHSRFSNMFKSPVFASNQLCTVEMTGRLLGGKVHGSLARAGKVKGQTSKVEKQEKKKKKTGRARRRIQYNRRFVNVVATFGRKKGPNSNS